jgi:hypothetical protein
MKAGNKISEDKIDSNIKKEKYVHVEGDNHSPE